MSDYSKLPPIAVSLGGFAFNGEHIEYWKTQATKADREIASLRAQVDALNGDLHQLGQERDDLKAQLDKVCAMQRDSSARQNAAISRAEAAEAQLASARKALTELAAECHRAKWEFDLSEDYRPTAAVARAMIPKAFDALHRIGDAAMTFRAALTDDLRGEK